jgi:hypothetical protein
MPAMPASPNAMRVCPKCGTIAPVERTACSVCDASITGPAFAEPRPDGVMFAEVFECDFQCRSCGLRSALDTFCFEAEVDCSRCGTTQAFDVAQWEEALHHAHSVADLSGPPAGGQGSLRHGRPLQGENPYKDLGVRFTSAELTQSGMTISPAGTTHRTLRVKVATGHPVCVDGHGPVTVTLDGSGTTRTECPVCHDAATYATPKKATELVASLAGLIDDEHRTDRAQVRLESSGGAVALSCPRCSASLPATQTSSVVTCQFCNTASYLPKRAVIKMKAAIRSRPFWLLFRGPSNKRVGGDGDAHDELLATSPKAMEPARVLPALVAAVASPAIAIPPGPAVMRTRKFPTVIVVAVVLAVLIGSGVVAVMLLAHHPAPARPPPAQHGGHKGRH